MRINALLAVRQSVRAASRLAIAENRAAVGPKLMTRSPFSKAVLNAVALPSTSIQCNQKRFARVAVPPSPEIAPANKAEVETRMFKAFKNFERWPEGKQTLLGGKGRPLFLPTGGAVVAQNSVRGYADKPIRTIKTVHDRILLVLQLYDKIDPEKVTMESHFQNDLGLDSLDHVEIIMAIEDEFTMEIPDGDAERLMTPKDIHQYICDKEDVYE